MAAIFCGSDVGHGLIHSGSRWGGHWQGSLYKLMTSGKKIYISAQLNESCQDGNEMLSNPNRKGAFVCIMVACSCEVTACVMVSKTRENVICYMYESHRT